MQVLSSLSSIPFYAPSAGHAPTNSAEVSAIASAYQVVSATATQLNAGTAYLTSVNETPISAARAGNAANASLATSAWYDGTGRLISALPDEATVSGIASSYVESGVSSKQDTLSFAYNTADQISSINGSALAGQGGGASVVVTGTAWDPDTSSYVYSTTSNLSAAERKVWTWQNGNKSDYISKFKDDSGNTFMAMASFLEAGAEQMYNGGIYGNGRLQFSPLISMFSADHSNVYGLSPLTYATGASMNLSAGYFRASYRGDTIFISRGPTGTIDSSNSSQIKAVRIEVHNSRGSNISAYDATKTGYYGTTAMELARSGVFVDASGNSSNTAASAKLTTGSLTFYRAGSSDTMSQSSIPYWNGKADGSALTSYALSADVSGTVDLVSTQSANWGGSALALSAGPGVKLEKVGDTLVASTDETLLWSGAASSACTLNESISSFNSIKLTLSDLNGKCTDVILSPTTASAWPTNIPSFGPNGAGITFYWVEYGSNNLTVSRAKAMTTVFTSTSVGWEGSTGTSLKNAITKVYGINRTAEA